MTTPNDPLFDVRDRVALVTGASSGLGESFARALAARGAAVVAAARRIDRLETLVAAIRAEGGRAHAVALDVTNPASVAAAVRKATEVAGPIDILVNNAGIADPKASLELKEEDWRRTLDTNLDGAWRVAQAARGDDRPGRPGSIVNIASILGLRVAGQRRRLRRVQGRRRAADEGAGARVGAPRHPRQRALPRLRRDADQRATSSPPRPARRWSSAFRSAASARRGPRRRPAAAGFRRRRPT